MQTREQEWTRRESRALYRRGAARFAVGSFLLAIAIPILCSAASGAEPLEPTEYQIKAAFLYNFAKFVEWPTSEASDNRAPIVIGVLGEDPFGPDLDNTVRAKTVAGRELAIRRFREPRDLEACHILFISSSEQRRLSQILRALRNLSVLTVGETEQFGKLGGIINFTMEENKVRFEINVDAADRAKLRLSSKLLKVARVIRAGPKD